MSPCATGMCSGPDRIPTGRPCTYPFGTVMYCFIALLAPRYTFVAKRELHEHWLTRRLLAALGTRYVEREEAARGIEDTRELANALHAGESLLVFPEGTSTDGEGILPFRPGPFEALQKTAGPAVVAAVPGVTARCHARTKSCAVTASPFDQRASLRRLKR